MDVCRCPISRSCVMNMRYYPCQRKKGNGMYEFQGTVKRVGELQKFSSGFEKQELIVEEDKDGNWSNVVAFTFKKNAISRLSGVIPGVHVKIGFVIDGREWTDSKTGKVRCFSDLVALRLEVAGHREFVPEPADPLEGDPFVGNSEEPPF